MNLARHKDTRRYIRDHSWMSLDVNVARHFKFKHVQSLQILHSRFYECCGSMSSIVPKDTQGIWSWANIPWTQILRTASDVPAAKNMPLLEYAHLVTCRKQKKPKAWIESKANATVLTDVNSMLQIATQGEPKNAKDIQRSRNFGNPDWSRSTLQASAVSPIPPSWTCENTSHSDPFRSFSAVHRFETFWSTEVSQSDSINISHP